MLSKALFHDPLTHCDTLNFAVSRGPKHQRVPLGSKRVQREQDVRPVCDRVNLSTPLVRLGRQANEPDPGVHDRQAVGLAVERQTIRSMQANKSPPACSP